MLFQQPQKVSLSSLYAVMSDMSSANTQKIRGVWEKELSVTINEETWKDIWSQAKNISICTRTKAIQLKIIHRIYIYLPVAGILLTPHFLLCVSNVKLKWVPSPTAYGHVINYKGIGLKYYVKWKKYFIRI